MSRAAGKLLVRYPWRFEVCKRCGRNNILGFRTPDSMWEKVTTDFWELAGLQDGVLCLWCFDELAYEKGIDWHEEPIEFHPVSSMANQKWCHRESVGGSL